MDKIYDLVIIGGGPGGLSAGIYAGRAKMSVLLIEKGDEGGQISTTSEVVNYPGIKEISGHALGHQMKEQCIAFGVEFLKAEVQDVNFSKDIKEIKTDQGTIKTLSTVIATGATPRKLGFPGEKEFTGRGVAYCATCDGEFFKGKDVFVIGAGYAAAEEAMFLTRFARKVMIHAREPEFTCAKTIADKVLAHPKITVNFNSELLEANGDVRLRRAKFKNNITGELFEHIASENETFGIFVFIGYQPQSSIFKGHIDLDPQGYIKTDENLETSSKDIYAVGDIRPKKLRQVVTAVSDGAIAATNLEKVVEEKREHLGITKEIKEEKEMTSISQEESENLNHFLDSAMIEQLQNIFGRFNQSLKLVAILDESNLSKDITKLLSEIEAVTDQIKVEFYKGGENPELEKKINMERFPTIAVLDSNGDYQRVKFSALPSGHEMNSFILALYNIAGPGQAISEDILKAIKSIDRPVNLKIAISLTCTLCPEVVMGAQRIATLNSNVQAEMLDIFSFPEMESKYNIMGVPALIIDDSKVVFGKKSIEEILTLIG